MEVCFRVDLRQCSPCTFAADSFIGHSDKDTLITFCVLVPEVSAHLKDKCVPELDPMNRMSCPPGILPGVREQKFDSLPGYAESDAFGTAVANIEMLKEKRVFKRYGSTIPFKWGQITTTSEAELFLIFKLWHRDVKEKKKHFSELTYKS